MQVRRSNGTLEAARFDRITEKVTRLSEGLDRKYIDPDLITKKTIEGFYDGITTRELDELTAEIAASMATVHPDYSLLAGRILVARLHQETSDRFSEAMTALYDYVDQATGENASMIAEDVYRMVQEPWAKPRRKK